MKLLLDENIPRKLKYRFSIEHEAITVPEMGWAGAKNGELLSLMHQKNLPILISTDKNMSHQQNLEKFGVTLFVLNAFDNRLETLALFIPKLEAALQNNITPGITFINI